MSTSKAKDIVKEYSDLLRDKRIPFVQIYLFGSYARGTAHEHSDIDVAVIQKKRKRDFFSTQLRLRRLAPKIDTRIEPILLEKNDLDTESTIMAEEVRNHGIRVE